MDFLKSTKGGPFRSAGGRIPEEKASAPRPSPKSAPEMEYLYWFGECSENQFGRPKKKVDKIFEFFFQNTPLLEKILDPPLS